MKKRGMSPEMLRRDLKDHEYSKEKLSLTETDIEYLATHEPPEPELDADGNEKHAIWFKTYMDSEAIYIFPPAI